MTLLLTSYASSLETWIIPRWKSNIAHKHFLVTCEIPNSSKGIISLALPLTWKVAILLKQISMQWDGNILQKTMFYKKTCWLWHRWETHNNKKNDQLRMRRMFKAKETTHLS